MFLAFAGIVGGRARASGGERVVRLRRGMDVPIAGAPVQRIEPGPDVTSVGLVAADWGIDATSLVRAGERVRTGQPLLRDRRHPSVHVGSPGTGVVSAVHVGARRALQSVVVDLDEASGESERFPTFDPEALARAEPIRIREALLASGTWAVVRTRPFGVVPSPEAEPAALFVTAIDTEPLCPDPRVVIAADPAAFDAGLTALTRLVAAPVFLCRGPGAALPTGDPVRVTVATFHGPHPAGLVGTHAHFLMPVSATRSIWHVGYQDVIAIGRTLIGGRPSLERVVALAGPVVRRPRLVRTRVGAAMDDLLRGDLEGVACRVVSGSVLSGRIATGAAAFLGATHRQVSVLAEAHAHEAGGSRRPARPWSVYGAPWRTRARYAMTTARRGGPEPMVPVDTFDRVMPLDVLATPLLRALLVGDVETAEALGCLELEEEDLALCTLLCPSRIDYGSLLRRTLCEIEART